MIRDGMAGSDHRQFTTRRNPYGLTQRELEVVLAVVEGKSNGEICVASFHSEQTVKFHMAHIFGKMDCSNRTQVAVKWVREQEFGAAA